MIKELDRPSKKYEFKARYSSDNAFVHIQNNQITNRGNKENLVQLIAQQPIQATQKQRISLELITTKKQWIYLGVVSEKHFAQKSTAKAASKNMISYKMKEGKSINVGGKNAEGVFPSVQIGQILTLEADIPQKTIKFEIDYEVVATLNIDFEGLRWYPFITFKHEGDSIKLI